MSGPRYSIFPADALDDGRVTDLHLRVLGDFGRASDRNGWLQANQGLMAKRLGRSRETINRTIRDLVEWGYVRKKQRFSGKDGRQMINDYQVVMDRAERVEDAGETQPEMENQTPPCDVQITGGVTPRDHTPCDLQTSHHKNDPLLQRPSSSPPGKEIEREARARGSEDHKKIEARGWGLLARWPNFKGMPKHVAMRAWMALSPEDRDTAERRFDAWLSMLKAQKRDHIPVPATYFGQRLFDEVSDPAEAPPAPAVAAPFGKLWGAIRMAPLVKGPGAIPPAHGFVATLIAQGGELGERERLAHQARHGWPMLKRMDEAAANRRGWTVHPDDMALERIAETFEQVRVGSDRWSAWQALFEARGWPWLPDPGRQEWVYFPAGGPERLGEFEAAIRGEDDAGGREAAE
jgi:hypothetical protein